MKRSIGFFLLSILCQQLGFWLGYLAAMIQTDWPYYGQFVR